MRIDRLLCYLRLVKTRGVAQRLIGEGHIRCNGVRIIRVSHPISVGDVLTVPIGQTVRVLQIDTLPERRGPAAEALACYRVLDGFGQSALAAPPGPDTKGKKPQ